MTILRGNEPFESLLGDRPFIVLDDLSDSNYHALAAFSSSGAKLLLRSAAHFKAASLEPVEPTPAMTLGTAIHMAVLEPERFANKALVSEKPSGVREKADEKAEREEKEAIMRKLGNVVLTRDQFQTALNVQAAAAQHPIVKQLLAGARTEVSVLWRDPALGIPCKARLDALRDDAIVIDVKSTTDASAAAFERAVASFQYHVQAGTYNIAHEVAFDRSCTFVWIVVETAAPYGIRVYAAAPPLMMEGIKWCGRAMKTYAEVLRLDRWPSYTPEILPLNLPRWAFKE